MRRILHRIISAAGYAELVRPLPHVLHLIQALPLSATTSTLAISLGRHGKVALIATRGSLAALTSSHSISRKGALELVKSAGPSGAAASCRSMSGFR